MNYYDDVTFSDVVDLVCNQSGSSYSMGVWNSSLRIPLLPNVPCPTLPDKVGELLMPLGVSTIMTAVAVIPDSSFKICRYLQRRGPEINALFSESNGLIIAERRSVRQNIRWDRSVLSKIVIPDMGMYEQTQFILSLNGFMNIAHMLQRVADNDLIEKLA